MSRAINKRDALDRATKRAFKAAKRSGKPITWRTARRHGQAWCVAMWPDFFNKPEAA